MAGENKFLNYEGVSHLWSEIVKNINSKVADEEARAKVAEAENAAAAAAAQASANTLSDYVGTIPETATATNVIAYIQEKTAGIATDTALEELTGRVAQTEADIDAIENDYLKAADKTELNNAIVANANEITRIDNALKLAVDNDVEGMDSIKELAAWINEHGEDASAYAAAIAALEAKTVLGVYGEDNTEYATVKAYVEAIEASTKAYAAEVAGAAETAAKNYANGLASNYDAAGSAAAAETAAKSYADGVAATAESNAKAHADSVSATAEANAKAHANSVAATAEANAKAYANGLAGNYDAAGAAAGALVEAKAYTDEVFATITALTTKDIDDAIAAAMNNDAGDVEPDFEV